MREVFHNLSPFTFALAFTTITFYVHEQDMSFRPLFIAASTTPTLKSFQCFSKATLIPFAVHSPFRDVTDVVSSRLSAWLLPRTIFCDLTTVRSFIGLVSLAWLDYGLTFTFQYPFLPVQLTGT